MEQVKAVKDSKRLDRERKKDRSVFQKAAHAYEDFEVNAESEEQFKFDYWLKVAGDKGNRHVFALLTRKENFEHWEAILSFVDAAKRSNQKGYIVDCGKKNNICPSTDTDNPVLYAFRDDEIQSIYTGDFQKDQVYDWMLTIKQPEIKMLREEIVPSYRSGMIPGFDRPRDTVVILFIHTKKSQIWRNYVKFAKENHGRFHLTALVSEEVKKWAIYPAFITMKPQDPYVKAFTLHKDIHWNRFRMACSQEQTSERTAFYAAVSGFDLFGMYLMSVFNVEEPSYVVVRRQEKGWCINKRAIETDDFLRVKAWVSSLEDCQELIEDFKFPIARLALLERYSDVEELEREHTAVERNRDEL
uniref:Tudor domain-containing protein n=1 Tax=Caenorhabditis tropicalis TaxID=1561998 RepID=A0A1I7UKK8_9PELO